MLLTSEESMGGEKREWFQKKRRGYNKSVASMAEGIPGLRSIFVAPRIHFWGLRSLWIAPCCSMDLSML